MPNMPDPAAWSYREPGDPERADIDEVREWLGDTDADLRFISDLRLQALVDGWMPRYDSLIYVAAVAAEQVAAELTPVVDTAADGATVALSQLAERFVARAARLRELYNDAQVGGEVDMENLMWDSRIASDIMPLHFGVRMHDNPAAGQQDYGGAGPHYLDPLIWSG